MSPLTHRGEVNRPGFVGCCIHLREWSHGTQKQVSREIRERTVRTGFEHGAEYRYQWEAICTIAAKIGCAAVAFREQVRQTQSIPAGVEG